MGLVDVITLPAKVAVAATQATLGMGQLVAPDGPLRRPGGYADQFSAVVGPGGLAEQINRLLTDPNGPIALLQRLADVTADDRPLGQAMAPGGALDRMLSEEGPVQRLARPGSPVDRFLQEGGGLDHLVEPDGPIDRLLADGGAFERITAQGGVLDRILGPDGLAETLLAEEGFVEKLTAEGGTLDQLVALGDTIDRLQEAVVTLNAAVEPLTELVNRIPGGRRKRPARDVYTQIEHETH